MEDKDEERHPDPPTNDASIYVVPLPITDRLLVEENTSFVQGVADLGAATDELQSFCNWSVYFAEHGLL